jgi:hypothetical protein
MSFTLCLGCYSLRYPAGGAYLWMFLNWALGFRALGCRLIWLESVSPDRPPASVAADVGMLRQSLASCGLDADLAVIYRDGRPVPAPAGGTDWLDLEAAASADLFVNLGYDLDPAVRRRFRRSAFVDIDPGLTQMWASAGQLDIGSHHVYFTLGETVGQPGSPIPSCGLRWTHVPPPVFLPSWPVTLVGPAAPYTTVSSWWDARGWIEIGGTLIDNSKRAAFLEYLDLPSRTEAHLELALSLTADGDPTDDLGMLARYGWRVRDAATVSADPQAHRQYVQASRGEFSSSKRGYRILATAWASERVVNYLASGKPAIVQHTGPSRFLPDADGLFRYRDLAEAAAALQAIEADYDHHARSARALAEAHFNALTVARIVIERSQS